MKHDQPDTRPTTIPQLKDALFKARKERNKWKEQALAIAGSLFAFATEALEAETAPFYARGRKRKRVTIALAAKATFIADHALRVDGTSYANLPDQDQPIACTALEARIKTLAQNLPKRQ
jgi:hypothetical protein